MAREVAPRATLQGPQYGLLAAAQAASAGPERWVNGLQWAPADCGDLNLYDPCSSATNVQSPLNRASETPNSNGRGYAQAYDTFVLQSQVSCSTGSSDVLAETGARAVAQLEALTSFGVERELWNGNLSRAAATPNRSLVATDADVTAGKTRATVVTGSGTGVSPKTAIGLLEEAFGSYPYRPWLHVGLLGAAFLTTRDLTSEPATANTYRTRNGSMIVPGAGYLRTAPDGTDPAAGKVWVYATGPVTVRLTPAIAVDIPSSVVRSTNSLTVTAEREAAATWDGCAVFACLMNLTSD